MMKLNENELLEFICRKTGEEVETVKKYYQAEKEFFDSCTDEEIEEDDIIDFISEKTGIYDDKVSDMCDAEMKYLGKNGFIEYLD